MSKRLEFNPYICGKKGTNRISVPIDQICKITDMGTYTILDTLDGKNVSVSALYDEVTRMYDAADSIPIKASKK